MELNLHVPYVLLQECPQTLRATSVLPSFNTEVRSVEVADISDVNSTQRKSLLHGPDTQAIYTANDSKLTTRKRYNKVLLYHTPPKTIQSRILLNVYGLTWQG